MITAFLESFSEQYGWIETLLSLQTRCFMALGLALLIALVCGKPLIMILHHHQKKGQPIRLDGPQSHLLTKQGTPTMGGFLILGASSLAILCFAQLMNTFVWVCLAVLWIYGFVGFADDYVKVTKQTANAMSAKMKLFLQFSTSLIAILIISYCTPEADRYQLTFPYFRDVALNLGLLYIPFAMIVITGASNGVNLSDGLDGLAGGLLVLAFGTFMIFAFVCGSNLAEYFYIRPIVLGGELAVVCAALVGGCVGFLWFNATPAKVFMGDTGSLALGALLGTISVMLKSEILLAVIGGVFVVESISVMIQVFWFKKTGKRFFRMAPIHHHFEQLGWAETTVVLRFWIVAFVLSILGLMALNLR